jgi:cyclin-dependent kinase regulatory subunit CKS1
MPTEIEYSEKYKDAMYEYRHVILPKDIAKTLPAPARILSEDEWRGECCCVQRARVEIRNGVALSRTRAPQNTHLLPSLSRHVKNNTGIGVQQSRGWVHYEVHRPEPHVLLFRRPLGTDPRTGLVDAKLMAAEMVTAC